MPEDKNNGPLLKKLIALILDMQNLEERFINFATEMRYGNSKPNSKSNGKRTNKKYEGGKETLSRIGEFLDSKKNDRDEEINPMDNEFYTIYRG